MRVTPDSIRVLHLDDDPAFAELTETVLEREDDAFDVSTATSVEAAFDHLDTADVDCIVSDYDMPRMDGIEFFESVQTMRPDVPFILFTGKGSEEVAAEAISAGVTDYLQKQGGTDQYTLLANRIRNAVEGTRSKDALAERNRRLETLISTLPGMVYECRNEPTWPMEFVAGEAEELCGYTTAELERNDVLWGETVLHPDDRATMWEEVQAALEAEEAFEVTYRITTKDGDVKWMWERGKAVDTSDGVALIEGFITDITTLTEREHELEATNAVLSTLFDALPVGLLAEDTDRNVMAANQHLVELFGLPDDPDTLVGRDCVSLAEKASDLFVDSESFVDRIDELVAGRTPTSKERLELVDGRTFERTYRPVELPTGAGHVWVYRDVSDQVAQTEELRRYEGIVAASGDPVYQLDAGGRFVAVNDALVEITGRDRDELLDEHISAVVPPDDIERGRELIRSLLSSTEGRGTFEMTLVTTDGERVPCEAHVALLPFESTFRGTVGVIRDITERKERERKLEGLQARTTALMRASTPAETARVAVDTANEVLGFPSSEFYLTVADGGPLEAVAGDDETGRSPWSEAALGRESAAAQTADADRNADTTADTDADAHTDSDGEGVADAGRDAHVDTSTDPPPAVVQEAFDTGDPLVLDGTNDLQSLADDPEEKRAIAYPMPRHGVFVVAPTAAGTVDETDTALVEILVSSLRAALDRSERERLLRRRERELERQNARLEEFASVVSHDLRNPLNVANGRLALARERQDNEHLEAVASAHDRMSALIEDLLTLARQGESAIDFEPVDLTVALDSCWSHVETTDATLVSETTRVVSADRSRLQQLLENVVRNVIEHGGEGVTITVGDLEDGFYVADDGVGIPPNRRETVFDTGYSTSRDGTGFGLSIVAEIVDAHGWDVTVTESDGGGARFEFTGVDVVE